MKRSRQLRLTLLGIAPLVLSACNSEEDLTYQSLDDCLKDTLVKASACSTAYQQAMGQHLAQAPRFYAPGECEDQYGNCVRYQQGGTSFWLPMMAGFLAGHWSSSYGSSGRPYVLNTGDWAPRPLYRTQDDWERGTWSSWGGGSYSTRGSGWSGGGFGGGDGSGRISTSTLERGGFGGGAMARGGWGGS
ncbi:MAG TPA: DUF1190 domain-containing protein [Fibrobacteria bacterium]|nr:DUF1190 domain-containing protein [Fibrobacteria bacterium]